MSQQFAAEIFKVGVRFGFSFQHGDRPTPLRVENAFRVPVRAFDQANTDGCAALSHPIHETIQCAVGIQKIRLEGNARPRIVPIRGFREDSHKNLIGQILEFIVFHVKRQRRR